ncbi:MAG: hypothetical protein QXQ40_00510 [Candidatus Aenigmatarchaeota archaeon]
MKVKRVVLISFSTNGKRFNSLGERNRFFRELYGWNQVVVKRNKKQYTYRRPGLLDSIPHMKIDDSVFLITERYLNKVEEYFNNWSKKVECRMLKLLMDEKMVDEYGR